MSSSYRRVYALGLARAFLSVDLPDTDLSPLLRPATSGDAYLLTEDRTAASPGEVRSAFDMALIARAQEALSAAPPWLAGVVERLPLDRWTALRLRELARHLEADEGLRQALATHEVPPLRHLFLGVDVQRAPTGRLAQSVVAMLPQLPDVPTLAAWLDLPVDTLEWLAACGARRRKRLLAQQHYVYHLTPKRQFGAPTQRMRLIESPRLRLKAVQRQLLADLLRRVPVHQACHGFVSGRSVLTHASAHVGQDVVLRFDLQDFFSHVGEARVRAIFESLGYPDGVAMRLAALCVTRTPDPVLERLRENDGIDRAQARRLQSAHLPQGAPTSPMLANLCAFRLDLRLAALARAHGARYTRYADDLVMSGPASLRTLRLEARVGAIAIEEGFRLNHRKTTRAGSGTVQRVAGIVVNQHLNMERAEFDRLRAQLHQCGLHGPAAHNPQGHADLRAHLLGRIAWATQLNPTREPRLRRLWDAIDWR